jgi:hypothetical protein
MVHIAVTRGWTIGQRGRRSETSFSSHHNQYTNKSTWKWSQEFLYINIFKTCTVSGYALSDRAIEVRSPTEARDLSSNLCVQTGSRAHPASCPMDTRGPFQGGKALPGREADHGPHLVPRSRMSRSYTSSRLLRLHRCVLGLLFIWLTVSGVFLCTMSTSRSSPRKNRQFCYVAMFMTLNGEY